MRPTHNKARQLLKKLICTTALTFLLAGSLHANFVRTNGTKLIDEHGNPLYLSGINLGNWLVWEGYLMMGDFNYRTHTQFFNELSSAFGSADKAANFEYQWRLNYVDEQAIADLKALGFNSVRVPFNYNLFWWNGQLRDNGFEYFDRVIDWCRTHGMYVLLDMHGAPGYQNPGDHADNVNSNASQPRDSVTFWDGNNVQIAATIWRHIANRYKDEPVVWGYDLINEPVPQAGREYELLPSLVTMRNAIREVDNNHIIVAEGSWWSSDLSKIDWTNPDTQANTGINYKWDDKLVYQIHHYGPAADTYGRENITNNLNIPLIIGEYGESDNGNIAAITSWAKQNLAGYFPWSFKKMSHDRTLWTVPTNAEYEQVKAYINNGGTPPTHLYDAMISFAQNNSRNGHSSHQWHQGFYDAVKPDPQAAGCSGSASHTAPGKTQAEHYCEMNGVEHEATSDTDGGENLGWIDAGDWVEFQVNFNQTAQYQLDFRVASPNGGGHIEMLLNNNWLAAVDVAATGGWQNWQTVSTSAYIEQGTYRMRLNFTSAGFNFNWFEFSANSNATSPLQAGQYYIVNQASGKVLDVADVSTANGGNIHTWDYFGAANQQWQLNQVADNLFELVSLNSNLCIDVDSGSQNAQQWQCFGSQNQRFYVEPLTDGLYHIRSQASSQVLQAASANNGANVQAANEQNASLQKWYFNPVN